MYSNTAGGGFLPAQIQTFPNFKANPHLGFSVTHIILGAFCIIFNIAALIVKADTGYVAIGIWGGILMTVTGSIGIVAVREKGPCTVTTILVMSILSAVAGIGVSITFSVGISRDLNKWYGYLENTEAQVALGTCLVIYGITECVIGAIQAAYCCKLIGTGNVPFQQIHTTHLPGNQQVSLANQQLYASVDGQMVPVTVTQQGYNLASHQASAPRAGANIGQAPYQTHQDYNLRGTSQTADPLAPPPYTANPEPLNSAPGLAGVHGNI